MSLFVAVSALVDAISISVSGTLDVLNSIDGSTIAVEMASAFRMFAKACVLSTAAPSIA